MKNQRTRTPNLLRPTALAPPWKRQIRSVNLDVPEVTSRGKEVFEESASWALVVGNSGLLSTSPGASQVGCKCYYRYSSRSFRKYRRIRSGSCGGIQLEQVWRSKIWPINNCTARPFVSPVRCPSEEEKLDKKLEGYGCDASLTAYLCT
jgi:hypothetical protein